MRPSTKLFLSTSLAFVAGVAVTLGFQRLYAHGGFLRESLDTALKPPITATKVLIVITALVVLSALPLGIAEWRAERAFGRAERAMRAERPADTVTRYEGPEGRGVLFDGPGGRTLLLEPSGGVGLPRVVDLSPVPVPGPDDGLSTQTSS